MMQHPCKNNAFHPSHGSLLYKYDMKYSIKNSLQYEGIRLSTFETFPVIHGVYATRLAGAGFYYNGKGDEVICFNCHISYENWKLHDSPKEVHRRLSPHCDFIQNTNSKFIPHAIAENNVFTESDGIQIDATESDKTLTRVSQTNLSSIKSNTRDSNRHSIVNLGICLEKPKYPKYSIRTRRLGSFENWPSYLTQSPVELRSAGFFYTGIIIHCL